MERAYSGPTAEDITRMKRDAETLSWSGSQNVACGIVTAIVVGGMYVITHNPIALIFEPVPFFWASCGIKQQFKSSKLLRGVETFRTA